MGEIELSGHNIVNSIDVAISTIDIRAEIEFRAHSKSYLKITTHIS